jgi:hypothetical protein
MKKQSWNDVVGNSVAEKMQSLGVIVREKIDIRTLSEIADAIGGEAVAYFEKDLAETSTYEEDLKNFAKEEEYHRPFIQARSFIAFGTENDPTFSARLEEFPLMITVIEVGERRTDSGVIPYIKGLMPFVDEFDVDAEPEGTFIKQ